MVAASSYPGAVAVAVAVTVTVDVAFGGVVAGAPAVTLPGGRPWWAGAGLATAAAVGSLLPSRRVDSAGVGRAAALRRDANASATRSWPAGSTTVTTRLRDRARRVIARGRTSRRRRRIAIADSVADVADLLRLSVSAGLTVHLAVDVVGRTAQGPIPEAFAGVSARVALGARLADELERLRNLGVAVGPLLDALLAAERYGAPLVPALERVAEAASAQRRRRLEEQARTVPVRMLFPLVACMLPSVGLLTVAPVTATALDGLALPAF